MTEPAWLVAAALTLAASVHCVGMCGGFVLAVGAFRSGRVARLFLDHLLLQLGKATSYAFLGALAGLLGAALVRHPAFGWVERALAFATALALAAAGLSLLGLLARRTGTAASWLAAAWGRLVGPLLTARQPGGSLVVGLAMGFLPCPLVYAGLVAAAAAGTPAAGAATLAGVALGTVPALTAVAVVGAVVPARARQILARAGGVLLLVVAAVTLTRGLGLHAGHAGHAAHAAHAGSSAASPDPVSDRTSGLPADHCAEMAEESSAPAAAPASAAETPQR